MFVLPDLALELDAWLPGTYEAAVRDNITIHAIADELDITPAVARDVIRYHRREFGGATYAILVKQLDRDTYVYWLSQDPVEIADYETRRIDGDTLSRLYTLHKVCQRGVEIADGRTVEGKRVRIIAKTVNRMIEDIEDAGLGKRGVTS